MKLTESIIQVVDNSDSDKFKRHAQQLTRNAYRLLVLSAELAYPLNNAGSTVNF
jgi:hypothetical protein